MSIRTFCRIDARIKCTSQTALKNILEHPLKEEDIYFIEINPMPTVWINNAFSHSYAQVNQSSNFEPVKFFL
jgi:D-alanine-D-alanine ligase-like ATP-grasp enzyme